MPPARKPDNESDRLLQLLNYQILDSAPDGRFDDIAELARQAFGVPIGVVSLVDENRQWFKSCLGLDATETPRDQAFCAYTILAGEPLVIEDATRDERTLDNPLVTGEPHIRFYVGVPLINSAGFALGSLCVIDRVAKTPTPQQLRTLTTLGRLVVSQMEHHRSSIELEAQFQEVSKLAAIAERSDNAVILTNAEGEIEWVNSGFTRITEYEADEVIGRKPGDFLQGANTDQDTVRYMHERIEAKEAFSAEVLNYSKTGREYWLKLDVQPFISEEGKVTRFMAIESDITAQKEAQRELENSYEALRSQSERMRALYAISASSGTSFDWQIDETLKAVCHLVKVDMGIVSRVDGNTYTVRNVFAPGTELTSGQEFDLGKTYCAITLAQNELIAIESFGTSEYSGHPCYSSFGLETYIGFPLIVNDRTVGTINFSSVSVRDQKFSDADKEFIQLVSHWIGAIIERAEATEDLEIARAAAEEATKAKSDFLASMSHELRTPMNSIMGFTKRLIKKLGGELSERDLDALHTVDRNAKHLLGLINDILDISKIEAGKMELDKTWFNFTDIVRGVSTTMQPIAEDKNLRLHIDTPDEEVQALGDRTKLTQVLTNLVSNAVKYTDEGDVWVTVRTAPSESGSPELVVAVKDTGVGIKEQDLKRLFTKFTQLDREERRRKGGTGLGLTITREYVEMHGGRVEVESHWQEGSTFTLHLPILGQPADTPYTATTQPIEGDSNGIRILCVDDDPDIRKFLQLTLRDEKFTVDLASSHDEAIAAIHSAPPDLICLDICMPDKSGFDFLDTLQRDKIAQQVPVVIVSAIADLTQTEDERVSCYLSKPISPDNLIQQVRKTLASGMKNVLVVEDCDDAAQLLVDTIQDCGVTATRAKNGQKALDVLQKEQFSAIILDLMMPEMDGFSFLTELHKQPELARTPVFIMSAKTLEGSEVRFLSEITEAVFTKGRHTASDLVDSLIHYHRQEQGTDKEV